MWRFLRAAAFVYFVMGKKRMAIAPEVSNSEKTHALSMNQKKLLCGKKRKPQKASCVRISERTQDVYFKRKRRTIGGWHCAGDPERVGGWNPGLRRA
jgi:hypothetical protein